ncbi:putative nuclease of restriction endonuclease-like (RecB) superfamily [Flavobacterium arsenatis]|uniref:Nuclease of restriction endonuclease-like (RecB) superfamily n=1 Tax=Flavobacterium arsenatis TaxID=1484332 RepID=A0ABU1TM73_9FLAO|nr:PDDEXK nuclease domain-containing protein [Flavobacterium arsenatis]MDR6967065.1 putative nuclease of restriction endonuclease-like (RecB) superfamily [Flavobacterium arsenatis]
MSKKSQINIEELDYSAILNQAINQIKTARTLVAKKVNTTANSVYWNLGKLLFEKHLEEGYGSGVVKQLSVDLKNEFPDMGLSPRNLWNMKRFYERHYQSDTKLLQSVAVLPWGHNLLLLDKVQSPSAVEFYANEASTKGWSRDLLLNAIKMDSYSRAENQLKTNNFSNTLPEINAEYANEVFKSSYNLGFLGITEPVKELELENRLIAKIRAFVLELGKGFSFIGNQYRLEYNYKEYFVDMLFFHRGMQSLVAIELKIGSFKAEYVGKMNLYLSLLDKLEKGENENPSIGIILCADKDHLDVEIALQDINKPIGVAEYQLLLPKDELQSLILNEINAEEENEQT